MTETEKKEPKYTLHVSKMDGSSDVINVIPATRKQAEKIADQLSKNEEVTSIVIFAENLNIVSKITPLPWGGALFEGTIEE